MGNMVIFIHEQAFDQNGDFQVQCKCGGSFPFNKRDTSGSCPSCGTNYTLEVVNSDDSLIAVQNTETGEWHNSPVQGFPGEKQRENAKAKAR
jgi:hypothetical protein